MNILRQVEQEILGGIRLSLVLDDKENLHSLRQRGGIIFQRLVSLGWMSPEGNHLKHFNVKQMVPLKTDEGFVVNYVCQLVTGSPPFSVN